MTLSLKKILGGAVVIGLIGGAILGANQVGYADTQTGVEEKGFIPAEQTKNEKRGEKHVTEKVAAYLDMNKEEIDALMQKEQLKPRHIAMAAVIAKLSNKTLPEVITTFKQQKNWDDVLELYHLNHKQVAQEMQKLFPHLKGKFRFLKNHPAVMYETLADYLGLETQEIQTALYQSRVHPEGAMKAAVLSKVSGKTFEEVLALKTEKKTWKEVAASLQVDQEKVKEERKKLQQLLHQNIKEWKQQFKKDQ